MPRTNSTGAPVAKQARAVKKIDALIAGAGTVFAQTNFVAARLEDVCEISEVGLGALYFHFKTKENLALAVIERQRELFTRTANSLMHVEQPAIEALVRLTHRLAWQLDNDPVVAAGVRLSTESAAVFSTTVNPPFVDWMRTVESFLHRAVAEKTVERTRDLTLLADIVISGFTGVHAVGAAMAPAAPFEVRLGALWQVLLPGIVTPERLTEVEHLSRLVLTEHEIAELIALQSAISTSTVPAVWSR